MPVELRKRKAPPPAPEPPAKKATKAKSTATKVKETVKETATKATKAAAKAAAAASATATATAAAAATNGDAKKPEVGDIISLEGFGGEIETNDGTKTTLKALVEESKAGVVLFTYPAASTGGCTKQACLFRDNYDNLSTATGLAIYGLSADSTKANTTFKTNKSLPFPLLCDRSATLIGAIGLKKGAKATRGVFVIDKSGKVLAAQTGSPEGTVNVVKGVVEGLKSGDGEEKVEEKAEEKVKEGEEKAEANGNEEKEEKKEGEEEAVADRGEDKMEVEEEIKKAEEEESKKDE